MNILRWFGLYTKKQYLELSNKSSLIQKELDETKFQLNKYKEILQNNDIEEVILIDEEEVLLAEIAEFKDVNLIEHVEQALRNNIIEEIKQDVEITRTTTNTTVIVKGELKYYKITKL